MSQINLTLLVITFLPLLISSVAHVGPKLASSSSRPKNSQAMTYIESSCNGTLYPILCIRSLSRFAKSNIDGPQHLAHVALSISLSRALQTRDYLLSMAKEFNSINENSSNNNNYKNKKREYLTLQDCMNQINDSVDQLSQAINELKRLNKVGSTTISDDFLWHISNVETWVGTALTDASSCVYAFPGHRMSRRNAAIKVKAMNVAQVTSNALALFHRYATKYREEAARNTKP